MKIRTEHNSNAENMTKNNVYVGTYTYIKITYRTMSKTTYTVMYSQRIRTMYNVECNNVDCKNVDVTT